MDVTFEAAGEAIALGLTFLLQGFGYFPFFSSWQSGSEGRGGKGIPLRWLGMGEL